MLIGGAYAPRRPEQLNIHRYYLRSCVIAHIHRARSPFLIVNFPVIRRWHDLIPYDQLHRNYIRHGSAQPSVSDLSFTTSLSFRRYALCVSFFLPRYVFPIRRIKPRVLYAHDAVILFIRRYRTWIRSDFEAEYQGLGATHVVRVLPDRTLPTYFSDRVNDNIHIANAWRNGLYIAR